MKAFIGILMVSIGTLGAQNMESLYECIYKYTVKGEDKKHHEFNDEGYCMLQLGNRIGKFYDYTAYQTDSVKQKNSSEQIVRSFEEREQRNVFYFDQTIYQNLPKGKMTSQGIITPNFYTCEENRNPIKWTPKEDTDTICGYFCLTAEGEYGGRKWIVKYTPEIPAQNGPWKLTGLPGLILDAKDSEGIHYFTAIAFRNGNIGITSLDNNGYMSTTREKFVKTKNKFEENPIANIPPESVGEMTIKRTSDNPRESTVLINGIQLRLRHNPYIPLEIE